MKPTIFIVISLFIPLWLLGQYAQHGDTITVGTKRTVAIQFPAPVNLVDIGNSEHFIYKTDGKLILLKSIQATKEITSLIVRYKKEGSEEVFSAFLEQGTPELFYFRPQIKESEALLVTKSVKPETEPIDSMASSSVITDNVSVDLDPNELVIGVLQRIKRQFFSYGEEKRYGRVELHAMKLSEKEEQLYIRINMVNKSMKAFQIGNVLITHIGTQTIDRVNQKRNRLAVHFLDVPLSVEGSKREDKACIIVGVDADMLAATDNKSKLIIKITEKGGRRKFQFEIDGKKLLNAKSIIPRES